MEIELNPMELKIACFAANLLKEEIEEKGILPQHGQCLKKSQDDRILGLLGEMAYCKARNKFWSPGTGKGDVGKAQIRTTLHSNGHLLVHPSDEDHHFGVLVIADTDRFKFIVRGWIEIKKAKDQKFWRDLGNGRPAFFVPQSALQGF